MKGRIASLVVAVAVFVPVAAVFAHPGKFDRPRPGKQGLRPEILLKVADKIGLTDEQREQIKDTWASHRKRAIELRSAKEEKQVDLETELASDSPNMKKVKSLILDIAEKDGELRYMEIEIMQNIKSILTDEQLEKLKNLREEFREKRRERIQEMSPGGPRTMPRK
ncbi:periplasmic heavy metal sensor [bacterium]|nr:periplasmic heavy metal sensor [bacterium]